MSEIFGIISRARNVLTGQALINRYYYHVDAEFTPTEGDVMALASSFEFVVLTAVLGVVTVDFEYVDTVVRSESTTAEYISSNRTGDNGLRSAPSAPAQLAWSVKLQRATSLTRSGGKRYSPIAESDVTGAGNLAGPGITTSMDALVTALSTPLAVDSVPQLADPIIWGQIKDGLPVSIINRVAYARFIDATTQKTRQKGRGI